MYDALSHLNKKFADDDCHDFVLLGSICVVSITFSLTAPLLSQELRHETDKEDSSETGVRKMEIDTIK